MSMYNYSFQNVRSPFSWRSCRRGSSCSIRECWAAVLGASFLVRCVQHVLVVVPLFGSRLQGHSPSALPAITEDNAFALEMSVPRSKHSYYWQGLIKVPRGPRRMDCAGPYGDMHVKFAISVYILHTGTCTVSYTHLTLPTILLV